MSPPDAEIAPTSGRVPATPQVLAPVANRPLLGAFYMAISAALFACLNALVKQASIMGFDALQIAFLRSFFAALAMAPYLLGPVMREGIGYLKPNRPGLMFFRGATSTCGVILWMTAVTMLPLAEVTAISFTAPLMATIGSALILKEVVRLRRWTAILVGFAGVLIILRPGMVPMEVGFIWAIAAAGFMAMAVIIIKTLTRTDTPERIVFWTNVWLTLGTLIPALWIWAPMTWEMWVIGIAMGVIGAVSHIFLTKSFSLADASIVLPLDYARLPFVAIIGYFAFGQTSDLTTWIGAAIIAGSAIYIAQREHQLSKRNRAEPGA